MSQTHPEHSGVEIPEAVGDLLAKALMSGHPATIAYVDAAGRPQISHRGSLQRLSAGRLALWARNPEGGIVKAMEQHPALAGLYSDFSDLPRRVVLVFQGRGHVEPDEEIRRTVYDNSPEFERRADPDRKGVAIVIEVDELSGHLEGQPVRMRRA